MWKALPLCSLRRLASLLVLLMVVKRLVEKQQTRRIPLHCSLGDQVAFLGDKDRDDGHQRKKIRAEMKDPLTAEGVCGPIMRSMKIPLDDDSEIDWWFLHPCAFLHELCKKCPRLGDLLGSVDKHKISVYMDEIKPGNVLRPDPGQSVAMWYWTLNDLPDWYHARNEGWFYFAAFPVNLIGQVVGGYSYLFARAMDFFWEKEEPFNFTSGFPCMSTRGTFLCQGKFGALLSDEKSITALWSLRGASGTKPCCFCQNVVGHMTRQQVQGHAWLIHYSCSSASKFAKHTSTTFREMRDRLEEVSGRKAECNKLGQAYGLVYKQMGILWHPTLRDLVCPVQQTFFDWMHILIASGGVAQYECNELLKMVKGQGISLEQVDVFASKVVFPKRHANLSKKFFQERVNFDDNTCLRCFAGELLSALPILVLFSDIILEPLGLLPEHRQCLQFLADILDILTQGPRALQLLPELASAIAGHNDLYFKLYPDCSKPKFHWLFHVPENLETFQKNLSCFNPERKHRATKSIANHVFNDNLQHHVTMRIAHATLHSFDSDDGKVCKETYLDGPVHDVQTDSRVFMGALGAKDMVSFRAARRMVTATGAIFTGDCVFDSGMGQVLFPKKFFEVKFLSGRCKFLCLADCHKHFENVLFEGCPSENLVDWDSSFRAVAYTLRANGCLHAGLQSVDKHLLLPK